MTTQVFARACAMIFAALAFSTGAMAQSGYGYNAAQLRGNVQDATVVQTRNVQVEQPGYQERTVGTAIGGVLGAVVANAAAGKRTSTTSRVIATGLGAAFGGYAGNKITQQIAKKDAQEVIIQLPNGQMTAVVQPMPADQLNPGDSVRVLQQGGQTRVIRTAGHYQSGNANVNYAQPYQQPPAQFEQGANWDAQPRTWTTPAGYRPAGEF